CPTPAVHGKLDIAAEDPLRWPATVRLHGFEVGTSWNDEGQGLIVEHHANDDRSHQSSTIANAPAGSEDISLAGAEWRRLIGDVPSARGGLMRRRQVLGEIGE